MVITSSGIAPTEGMGAMEPAVVDPADMDQEAAVADEAEQAEAVADVVERAVAVADAADQAEADRTARAGKAAGTTAAQCRIYAATTVVSETTLKLTAVRKGCRSSTRTYGSGDNVAARIPAIKHRRQCKPNKQTSRTTIAEDRCKQRSSTITHCHANKA